eukprot:TRINITY_DN7892_c0_g3_i2.p1 TRINITY_DN7892_c0_g3~~TRINITY_DN7892_c0_g3_i2.p1  ORF type:complete len:741 (-),score=144.42 TRINITY_DN7892_c0_g3_i2:164-2386(-)
MTGFVQSLKTFVDTVKLPTEVFRELRETIAHFAFVMTVFKKYEETLNVCAVAGTDNERLKTAGWLLYILARAALLKGRNEIVESACLLIVVLIALTVNRPDLLRVLNQAKNQDLAERGEELEVKKKLCEMFKLRNFEVVDAFMDPFLRFLQQFAFVGNLKGSGLKDYATLFTAEHLDFAIKRLNEAYQQNIPPDGIDERCFIGDSLCVITPARLTPFARQGIANISLTPKRIKRESETEVRKDSMQVLKYSTFLTNRQVVLTSRLNEFKIGSSSPYPTIKIQATPITRAMEMNNWLHEQITRVKILENGLTSEYLRLMSKVPQALPKVKLLLDQSVEKMGHNLGCLREGKLSGKGYQMKCLYFRLAEEVLKKEEKANKSGDITMLLQSEEFHKGVFVAAVEIILFIHNSTDLMFEETLDLIGISAFDFWKLLSKLPKFEVLIPGPVLFHFSEIENRIFESLAWERKSPIYSIISKLMNAPEDQKHLKFSHERFFKRLLEISAEHVEELAASLEIDSEVVKERVWDATKLCLSSEIDLLVDRHLDHIIMCGAYAVAKMEQSKNPGSDSYSFNQIITCYLQLGYRKGRNSARLFQNVKLEDEKTGDIIEFYNAIYVPRMKAGLFRLCLDQEGSSILTDKAKIKVLAPISPLKDISDKSSKSTWQQKTGSNQISLLKSPKRIAPMLTPRTQRLFAYSETPLQGRDAHARGPQATEPGDQRRSYKNLLVNDLCKPLPTKGKLIV